MTRKGWPSLWLFRRSVLAGIGLVAGLVTIAVLWANPGLPEAPELDRIRFKVPEARPMAPALARLLRDDPAELDPRGPPLEPALTALREGQWLPVARAALAALERLPLDRARAALLTPGCLPRETPTPDQPERYSLMPLIRAARLLALRATARAQLGQVNQAARGSLELHRRLLQLERDCAPTLIEAMLLAVTIEVVTGSFGHLLAHPALEAALQREIWQQIKTTETRPNPMPDALRSEAAWIIGSLTRTINEAHDTEGAPPRIWPWYSEEGTRELFGRIMRRSVWLAGQPLRSTAWTRRFPEEEYLERLERQPGWLALFRYNAIGKILMAVTPGFRKYTLKWHQGRCRVAALRARWLHDLKQRARDIPAEATKPAPRDPFTGSGFVILPDHNDFCGVPSAMARGASGLEGRAPPTLPPAPTSPPAPPSGAPPP